MDSFIHMLIFLKFSPLRCISYHFSLLLKLQFKLLGRTLQFVSILVCNSFGVVLGLPHAVVLYAYISLYINLDGYLL
jgi:hypothetical protein